jgi:hypothetical protein
LTVRLDLDRNSVTSKKETSRSAVLSHRCEAEGFGRFVDRKGRGGSRRRSRDLRSGSGLFLDSILGGDAVERGIGLRLAKNWRRYDSTYICFSLEDSIS